MSDSERGNGDGIFGNRADEEIYEAFPQRPIAYGIDPADGLPRPTIQHAVQMAYAPPLSPDTLVCMADMSVFVVRDSSGYIMATFPREKVTRTPNGEFVVKANDDPDDWIDVEPLRPQCKHYARQMIDFQDDPDAKFVARLCTARRNSEEGFLSVRDSQVYACELRTPPHFESVAQLDEFDEEKVRLGRERTEQREEFDVDAALAAQEEPSHE